MWVAWRRLSLEAERACDDAVLRHSEAAEYAAEVARECAAAELRAELDVGNEKITYKVREHSLAKVPIMLVVGRREAANRSVALRRLGGKEQEALALGEAVARLKEEATVPSSS